MSQTASSRLDGRTVLLVRDPARAVVLRTKLEALGATVFVAPATATEPGDQAALDATVRAIGSFTWVAVTSANAVEQLRLAATRTGVVLADGPTQWAAVGPATRAALEALGVAVVLQPPVHSAAGLATAFGPVAGHDAHPSVLLPQSDLASPTLADGLQESGFDVHVVTAYRTVPADFPTVVRDAWATGRINAVVLSAGSAAREVARQLGPRDDVAAVAIGAPTAAVARSVGLHVDAVAKAATADALAQAVVAACRVTA